MVITAVTKIIDAEKLEEYRHRYGFIEKEYAAVLNITAGKYSKLVNKRIKKIDRITQKRVLEFDLEWSKSNSESFLETDEVTTSEEHLINCFRSVPISSKMQIIKYASNLVRTDPSSPDNIYIPRR
jgi:predicted PilT family ATPase